MHLNKVLIIGTVWPEPNSTAAGSRLIQIIEQFQIHNFEVVFSSTACFGEFSFNLNSINVKTVLIELNNASFDTFILDLQPTVVVFDRFMIEEQFGWRVATFLPNCLRILDTEDLHFIRNSRLENFKKNKISTDIDYLNSDLAKREIASIYRCDVSLIISEIEINILIHVFRIDKQILFYLPFLLPIIKDYEMEELQNFSDRNHFMTIGNFRHEPNWNSVLYLKETIWPLIKLQIPEAEIHIYGSYITKKALDLHNSKEGFLVKGRAENAFDVIRKSRILLAPLRFGAGIKGKLTDAMQCGTPSVTTTIGAEAMNGNLDWNGLITDNPIQFAKAAVDLYTNKDYWEKAQKNGFEILKLRFNKEILGQIFINKIIEVQIDLLNHRTKNFIGEMIQTQMLKSTKYMSKWIEEKNKIK